MEETERNKKWRADARRTIRYDETTENLMVAIKGEPTEKREEEKRKKRNGIRGRQKAEGKDKRSNQ